ncbi:hypothetical protein ACIGW1_18470 [Streptomyces sp. NPDC053780]|uniref:hypothetical protein n=1 Tax=unclassified Streptomyces TaxID=2593676 RepID=UPI003449534D
MTTLDEFMTALSGDSVDDAVSEGRCLAAPVGCGASVFNADGTMRGDILDPIDEADYVTEWRITGVCADCQDEREELEDQKVERHTWATNAYVAHLDLMAELMTGDGH